MKQKIIDIHHHVFPPDFTIHKWSMEEDMEAMDQLGITGVLLSCPLPADSSNVRKMNEFMAQKSGQDPCRYGFLASIPFDDIDKALEEITYACDVLHADGFSISSHSHNIYIGDDRLDPVFDELNRRKSVVFLHPSPQRAKGFDLRMPTGNDSVYEFVFETTRSVMDYIYQDKMLRNPDIRWILSHAGGTIPYLAYRLSHASEWGAVKQKSDVIMPQLRSVYYDLALSYDESVVSLLKRLSGLSHIVFGTDYPPTQKQYIANNIEDIKRNMELSSEEQQAVLSKNITELFPRFKESGD